MGSGVEGDASEILRENLQKIIVNVIRETINADLNLATGRIKKDEQLQSSSYWRSSSKNTVNTSNSSDKQSLTADISPIVQTLSEFITPPDQTTSRSWSWYWSSSNKSPVTPSFIQISIPPDIQQQWEIPDYGAVIKSRSKITKGVRKFPEIDTPVVSFKESQEQYPSNLFFESDVIPIRTGLLEEIRRLKEYPYNFLYSQPQSLKDFINQKNSVRLLFDFPKAYAYSPGIEGSQLLPKILRFFEEYEALITSYRRNLQKTDKSDLSLYLNPKRHRAMFCKSNKSALFGAFPLLDPTELMHEWVSLEVFSLFDRKFLEDKDKGSFLAELEENVVLLPMVDGFPDESLSIGTLDISRLICNAKRILFFKEKCRAIKEGKTLPSERQELLNDLFQEKCNETKGVDEAIQRMVGLEKSQVRKEDDSFRKDRDLLIPFFTELFRQILTECLSEFGLTSEKLETLKRLSSPLQPIQSLNPSGSFNSTEDSEVTLHVPVRLRKNSHRSSKKPIPSSGGTQGQSGD
jgi:hypothetical protein